MYVRRALMNGGAHERIRRSSVRTTVLRSYGQEKEQFHAGIKQNRHEDEAATAIMCFAPFVAVGRTERRCRQSRNHRDHPALTTGYFHRLMLVSNKRGSSERATGTTTKKSP
jgi:hypothetical protein